MKTWIWRVYIWSGRHGEYQWFEARGQNHAKNVVESKLGQGIPAYAEMLHHTMREKRTDDATQLSRGEA